MTLSWADAEGGVLATGPAEAVNTVGAAVACAALRQRKAILVLDLAGASPDGAGAAPAGFATAVVRLGLPPGPSAASPEAGGNSLAPLFGQVLRDRGVAVVTASGPAGCQAVATLTRLLSGLRRHRLRTDAVICLTAGEQTDPAGLAELLRAGQATGTAMLVLTSQASVGGPVRAAVSQIVIARPDGTVAVRQRAPEAGRTAGQPAGLAMVAAAGCAAPRRSGGSGPGRQADR